MTRRSTAKKRPAPAPPRPSPASKPTEANASAAEVARAIGVSECEMEILTLLGAPYRAGPAPTVKCISFALTKAEVAEALGLSERRIEQLADADVLFLVDPENGAPPFYPWPISYGLYAMYRLRYEAQRRKAVAVFNLHEALDEFELRAAQWRAHERLERPHCFEKAAPLDEFAAAQLPSVRLMRQQGRALQPLYPLSAIAPGAQ